MIEVIVEKCTGCGNCVDVCPYEAISIVDNTAIIDLDACTLCGACIAECPFDALFLRREETGTEPLEDFKGILVVGEIRHGMLMPVTHEILGKARELADVLDEELMALLLGYKVKHLARELIEYGADKVILVDDPSLEHFLDESYTQAAVHIIQKYKPGIVLAGATPIGRAFIPRVAVRLNTGLTADCTGLDIDIENRHLLQTRPAFGGNIMATIRCPHHRPQMATIRPKVMTPLSPEPGRDGEIFEEKVKVDQKTIVSKFLQFVRDETQQVSLTDANIIVSGGRGLKNADNFELLHQLAKRLNGAVGASRAAVDAGWIPYSHQVGQTGKTVKPKIYIACGISGAIQHLVGMQSSDIIIAINNDPDAPIFQVADYGIVGDLFEVIPHLLKKLE